MIRRAPPGVFVITHEHKAHVGTVKLAFLIFPEGLHSVLKTWVDRERLAAPSTQFRLHCDEPMSSESTSETLLHRLRQPTDGRAWDRFVELYAPLLYYWAGRTGCPSSDRADLVQEVLLQLVQKLPDFQYDPQGSFRGWLRTVALNCWSNQRRKAKPALPTDPLDLDAIAVPDDLEQFWHEEFVQRVLHRALALMQQDFEDTTWRACWACVVEAKSPTVVAQELGLSVGAVYVAKSRVVSRLRKELAGMLE